MNVVVAFVAGGATDNAARPGFGVNRQRQRIAAIVRVGMPAQTEIDHGGQIQFGGDPENVADAVGDVRVFVGLLDRFEIWNPTRYETVKATDGVMAPDAFKLME